MTGRENQHPTFGRLDGPVVLVGFGSIGRGTLPLILRHFEVDPADIVVIAPDTRNDRVLDELGIGKVTAAVTADNYRALLTPLLTPAHVMAFALRILVFAASVLPPDVLMNVNCVMSKLPYHVLPLSAPLFGASLQAM